MNFFNSFFKSTISPTLITEKIRESLNINPNSGQIDVNKLPINEITNRVRSQKFDAVIAEDGSGDYTSIEEAWNDGHRRLLFRKGNYTINNPINHIFDNETKSLVFVAEDPKSVHIEVNEPLSLIPVDKKIEGNFTLTVEEDEVYLNSTDVNFTDYFNINSCFVIFFKGGRPFWISPYATRVKVVDVINAHKIKVIEELTNTYINYSNYFLDLTSLEYFITNNNQIDCIGQYLTDMGYQNVQYSTYTLERGSNILTATNGNFTQSCKEGYYVFFTSDTWRRHHIKIREVVDDNTLILEMTSLISQNNTTSNFIMRNTPKTIIFDGLKINCKDQSFLAFYSHTLLSQVVINNCDFYGNSSPICDAIGYGWIFNNVNSYTTGGEMYVPFGSLVINCNGNFNYRYTPFITWVGCIFNTDKGYPIGLGQDVEGYNNVYVGCRFSFLEYTGEEISATFVGCEFSNGIYTTLPKSLKVEKIIFSDGELSSTNQGLIYKDNDYVPVVNYISQDRFTWCINNEVLTGTNIDGFRRVLFSGKLVKIFTTGGFGTNGSITLSIKKNNTVVYTNTITIADYTNNLNINVEENDKLSIDITNVNNVSNLVIEIIERS